MKKLFIIIFLFTTISYSQVLKGKIPVEQNGRPVNHYVVDDTIVTNLKSYAYTISVLPTENLISLKDIFYIDGSDTTFYFDSDKKIYNITIKITPNNDSNSYLYICNKNDANYLSTMLVNNRFVDFYENDEAYKLYFNESITLYANKLSNILVKSKEPDLQFSIKYESY